VGEELVEEFLEIGHGGGVHLDQEAVFAGDPVALADLAGESPTGLNLIAVWRESTVFTDAERAALELTEQGTRMGTRGQALRR
jgi:hypothetical protein